MPDTGEANDEMRSPTAPKISEMCSLKPFSCCCCWLLLLLLAALAEKTKTGFAGNNKKKGWQTKRNEVKTRARAPARARTGTRA